MNDNLKANEELQKVNIKCAAARAAWLRSSLDLNTLGSDHLTKEANDNREAAWLEYQRCQADVFRISKMVRLLQK
jgi:hypothetical protein